MVPLINKWSRLFFGEDIKEYGFLKQDFNEAFMSRY